MLRIQFSFSAIQNNTKSYVLLIWLYRRPLFCSSTDEQRNQSEPLWELVYCISRLWYIAVWTERKLSCNKPHSHGHLSLSVLTGLCCSKLVKLFFQLPSVAARRNSSNITVLLGHHFNLRFMLFFYQAIPFISEFIVIRFIKVTQRPGHCNTTARFSAHFTNNSFSVKLLQLWSQINLAIYIKY
jgi:hypothetical protein